MGQQVFPFKLGGGTPLKVQLGVGDETARLLIMCVSSAPLAIDGGIWGWFAKEASAADLNPMIAGGVAQGDPEFMAGNWVPSPWFDVPPGTAFVLLNASVATRGMIVMETGPCRCGKCGGH